MRVEWPMESCEMWDKSKIILGCAEKKKKKKKNERLYLQNRILQCRTSHNTDILMTYIIHHRQNIIQSSTVMRLGHKIVLDMQRNRILI